MNSGSKCGHPAAGGDELGVLAAEVVERGRGRGVPGTQLGIHVGTPRAFRIDDDDWDDLGAVAEAMERDRGWLLCKLVAWYLGRPGAELPERPVRR